jgi:hypothetical protein
LPKPFAGHRAKFFGASILVVRSSAFSYSKTLESIQGDRLLEESGTSIFGPFTNEIPILPFEYEYRFAEYEYEYEKNQWYELPATIMTDGPVFQVILR